MDNNTFNPNVNPAQSGAAAPNVPNLPPLPNYPNANLTPAKTSHTSLIKTVVIVVLSLLAAVFLGLFIWMYVQWNEVSTDVSGQIEVAVREAEYNLRAELEAEFEEKEKYPFKTFAGPSDFGELTFEYPKTWSVYIPNDAHDASDFEAYLNPDHVAEVDDETIMALRVSIVNELTENVLEDYNDKVADQEMTMEPIVLNNSTVNVYRGLLDSDYYGLVCVFKIRDKTVILQTDAYAFENDFRTMLKTVRFKA